MNKDKQIELIFKEFSLKYNLTIKYLKEITKHSPIEIINQEKEVLYEVIEKINKEIKDLQEKEIIISDYHLKLSIEYLVIKNINDLLFNTLNQLFNKIYEDRIKLEVTIMFHNSNSLADIINFVTEHNIENIKLSDIIIKKIDEKFYKPDIKN